LIKRHPITVVQEDSIRTAVELMAHERIGRLPVVKGKNSQHLAGMISRSDILEAYAHFVKESGQAHRTLKIRKALRKTKRSKNE
jgi:CBS domain-containing protein